jgi:hypothetical protein
VLLIGLGAALTVWLTATPLPRPVELPALAEQPSSLDSLDADRPRAWGKGADEPLPERLQPGKVYQDTPTARLVGLVRGQQREAEVVQATSADGRWRLEAGAEGTRLLDAGTGAEIAKIAEYRTKPAPPKSSGPGVFVPSKGGLGGVFVPFPDLLQGYDRLIVTVVALSADGRQLVLGGRREVRQQAWGPEDRAAFLQAWTWEADKLAPGEILLQADTPVDRLAVSPDGNLLATGRSAFGGVRLSQIVDGKIASWTTFSLPEGKLEALQFAPDNRTLATAGAGKVFLFDLALTRPEGGRRWWPSWVALGVAAALLVVAGLSYRRWGWLLSPPGWALYHWMGPLGLGVAGACLVVLPLRWLIVPGPEVRAVLSGGDKEVRQVVFSTDGRQAAVLGADNRLSLWGLASKERTHAMALPWSARRAVFAPDGRHLLVADDKEGRYVLRLRTYDDASAVVERCRAVLRDSPDDVAALVCRAQAHLSKGRTEEALADLAEALRHDPESALAHYHSGRAYLDRGEYARARAEFERAVALDPGLGR